MVSGVSIATGFIMARAFRFLIITIALLVSACSQDDDAQRKSIDYFETHLQKDMSHTKLISTFGQPDKDMGSGIHIYVYKLEDNTEVWVGCTDKILYANHVDQDQNLLKVLI